MTKFSKRKTETAHLITRKAWGKTQSIVVSQAEWNWATDWRRIAALHGWYRGGGVGVHPMEAEQVACPVCGESHRSDEVPLSCESGDGV